MSSPIVLGSRERRQPPPPHVLWQALADPHLPGAREWLFLDSDEVEPRLLGGESPAWLEWSSLWPDRPRDVIRFDLRPVGAQTALRWTLRASGPEPTASRLGHLRKRLNRLINADLRYSFGQ